MVFNIIKQQLLGIFNLSIPIMVISFLYPAILDSNIGILSLAILVGAYVCYLGYKAAKQQVDALQFLPSGAYKEEIDSMIKRCSLEPEQIKVRYAFSNEMIACTNFNTVMLDPLFWSEAQVDPQMQKAKEVVETYIVPTLADENKTRINLINAGLTIPAKRFIFKHELAHVANNYSIKKLILTGSLTTLVAFIAIKLSVLSYGYLGKFAVLLGIILGGILDLVFTYASNLIFKAREEKNADLFAAKFSDNQDIKEAADFFETYQTIFNENDKSSGIMSKMPTIVLSGHYDGKSRAKYLRELVAK